VLLHFYPICLPSPAHFILRIFTASSVCVCLFSSFYVYPFFFGCVSFFFIISHFRLSSTRACFVHPTLFSFHVVSRFFLSTFVSHTRFLLDRRTRELTATATATDWPVFFPPLCIPLFDFCFSHVTLTRVCATHRLFFPCMLTHTHTHISYCGCCSGVCLSTDPVKKNGLLNTSSLVRASINSVFFIIVLAAPLTFFFSFLFLKKKQYSMCVFIVQTVDRSNCK